MTTPRAAPLRRFAVASAVIVVAVATGLGAGRALQDARAQIAAHADATGRVGAASSASPLPTTTPTAIGSVLAKLTRDEALALVRSLSEVVRVDRIEAKLLAWSEFAPVGMGVDRTGHQTPLPDSVWAIAIAGDTYPTYWGAPLGTPQEHFAWSLWGIDALRGNIASLKVGSTGSWPPGFDALADHIAVAPTPSPSPPPPVPFDLVAPGGPQPMPPIVALAAADASAMQLWAVVTDGPQSSALQRSADGGRTWQQAGAPAGGWSPARVAAADALVLVSDLGRNAAATSGGLYLSKDAGSTWRRVANDPVGLVVAVRHNGVCWFFAEHPRVPPSAATGPSKILASLDGETWREIGEVPGPASFVLSDAPLFSHSKVQPGDGLMRVEGTALASLRLVPIPGSRQTTTPFWNAVRSELWSLDLPKAGAWLSLDGGRTSRAADAGLAGRIAGLFVANGILYAIGDGAYYWDGATWRVASNIVTGKARAVFQLGDRVLLHDLSGALWRSR
jgi:hypothetical protein